MSHSSEPATAVLTDSSAPGLKDWVKLMRPAQWTKNLFVLAPLLFSGRGSDSSAIIAV